MTKVKLIGIISSAVLLLGVVTTLIVFKDIRSGIVETVKGTITDTKLALEGNNKEPTGEENPPEQEDIDNNNQETSEEEVKEEKPIVEDNLKIYIPNTNGDFIVVEDSGEVMIINSSYKEEEKTVKNYLDSLGIKKVKYAIGTNYHPTSVGGMSKLLSYVPAEYIVISSNITQHEKSKDLMDYLKSHKLTWTTPGDSSNLTLGKSKINLLTTHYGGSFIVVITNKTNTFVFTGSTTKIEDTVLKKIPKNVDLYGVTQGDSKYTFHTKLYERLKPKNVIFNDREGVDPTKVLTEISKEEQTLYQLTKSKSIVIKSNGVDIKVDVNSSK